MIAVIADDLTGAAEISGIGLRYGLSVKVVSSLNGNGDCDLLIINADTRSVSLQKAKAITHTIMEQLLLLQPAFIFKKIDSVLRGHILAEIRIMMKMSSQKQAFIIAGNPSLGRIVRDGLYFVHGLPVHHTGFAQDPEFPVSYYDVGSMLRAGGIRISILPVGGPLPLGGITVGDVEKVEDFDMWAFIMQSHPEILLAGTSLFFAALLQSKGFTPQLLLQPENVIPALPALYISGTAFSERVAAIRKLADDGGPVCYAPPDLFGFKKPSLKSLQAWTNKTVEMLEKEGKAIMAFDNIILPENSIAAVLRKTKAQVVQMIFEKTAIRELVIEGGATSAAILNRMNFNRFIPTHEWLPGVIRMQPEEKRDCFITIKPGSYPWPPGLWNFEVTRVDKVKSEK